MLRFETNSDEETVELGKRIARLIGGGAVVLLIGNLGAGKTTLAKGIVTGLGAADPEEVSSPTYTLIHEYPNAVYHIDLYRLDTAQEVSALGLEEICDRPGAVVLIEWGERFPQLMPERRLEIQITANGDHRLFELRGPVAALFVTQI